MRTNVDDRGTKNDCTPLMEAASAGHADIVKLLIAHGANMNAQSTIGMCLIIMFQTLSKNEFSQAIPPLFMHVLVATKRWCEFY